MDEQTHRLRQLKLEPLMEDGNEMRRHADRHSFQHQERHIRIGAGTSHDHHDQVDAGELQQAEAGGYRLGGLQQRKRGGEEVEKKWQLAPPRQLAAWHCEQSRCGKDIDNRNLKAVDEAYPATGPGEQADIEQWDGCGKEWQGAEDDPEWLAQHGRAS
ncbi:hypothetical protein GGR00_004319 [Aminobacter aganoensis]|uniref:Uncharacterized protein n=1 Tax=Aminobacter aganoensis TaxID=83264 RepID=A0A7X0FB71_9HYPH|nr:hypothetical protein [Aminobacter aganoensis]